MVKEEEARLLPGSAGTGFFLDVFFAPLVLVLARQPDGEDFGALDSFFAFLAFLAALLVLGGAGADCTSISLILDIFLAGGTSDTLAAETEVAAFLLGILIP